jgi:hypothetical protein
MPDKVLALIPTSKRQELEVSISDYKRRRLALAALPNRGAGFEPSRSVAFPLERLADDAHLWIVPARTPLERGFQPLPARSGPVFSSLTAPRFV